MKLFLASEAKNPQSIKDLEKFVGGFEGKSMVYIPTAANGEGWGSWKTSRSIGIAKSLPLKSFKIVELERLIEGGVQIPDLNKAIGTPDILWVAGGAPGYLLYWLRRVGLDKYLPKLFKSGTVYVGSSAGSMVCAKTQRAIGYYIGESEMGAELLPGLGLIDFEIYPHFRDELLPQIKKLHKKGQVYLLKDGEAIVVDGGKMKILGEKRVVEK